MAMLRQVAICGDAEYKDAPALEPEVEELVEEIAAEENVQHSDPDKFKEDAKNEFTMWTARS